MKWGRAFRASKWEERYPTRPTRLCVFRGGVLIWLELLAHSTWLHVLFHSVYLYVHHRCESICTPINHLMYCCVLHAYGVQSYTLNTTHDVDVKSL